MPCFKKQFPEHKPEAFFISPEGCCIPVPFLHINAICSAPALFGLTQDYLRAAFLRHNEAWETEGLAREEIIPGLLEQNWVRVRLRSERGKGPVCIFQVHELNRTTASLIADFAKAVVSGNGSSGTKTDRHHTASVKISSGKELTDGWLTLMDLLWLHASSL